MTRLSLLAAAAAAATLAVGAAAAQERSGPHEIDFIAIDSDGNGSLSRAELQARAVARLARADANSDGALDRAEIVAIVPPRPGSFMNVFSTDPAESRADRMLALLGATETGRVEVAVVADRRVNNLLATADTDRDAAISQAEADAFNGHHSRGRDRGWRHGSDDDDDHGGRHGPEEERGPDGRRD
jgi:hypothetical protein